MACYFDIWDQLKEAGVLLEYQTPEGIMIDNQKILELTREKLNLKNPNFLLF